MDIENFDLPKRLSSPLTTFYLAESRVRTDSGRAKVVSTGIWDQDSKQGWPTFSEALVELARLRKAGVRVTGIWEISGTLTKGILHNVPLDEVAVADSLDYPDAGSW